MLSASPNATAAPVFRTAETNKTIAGLILWSIISLAALAITGFAFFKLKGKGLLGHAVWHLIRASTISFSLHCLITLSNYALKLSLRPLAGFSRIHKAAAKDILELVYHVATLFHYFTKSLLFITIVNFKEALLAKTVPKKKVPKKKVPKIFRGLVTSLCLTFKAFAIAIFTLNVLTLIDTNTPPSVASASRFLKIALDGMMISSFMIGIGFAYHKVLKNSAARLLVLSGILLLCGSLSQLFFGILDLSVAEIMQLHIRNLSLNGGAVVGALALVVYASQQLIMDDAKTREKCSDGID